MGNFQDFQKECSKYCLVDSKICFLACICFEESVLRLSKGRISFLNSSTMTIAGLSSLMFRGVYMPGKCLGRTPELGYSRSQTSETAVIFFSYLNTIRSSLGKPPLNFSENLTKEFKISKYYVDCICDEFIGEVTGCSWHGCPSCYAGSKAFAIHPVLKVSYRQLHMKTMLRAAEFVSLSAVALMKHHDMSISESPELLANQ